MQNEIQTIAQTETQAEGPQPEIRTTKCLNCGTEFEGKFCPECGQSAETGRFTMKFIWENLLAAFTSKDGGVWFTLKNLFTRPSAMIVEILNGKRRSFFSPFPMLFFVLTIYILLFSFTGSRGDIQAMEQEIKEAEITIDSDLDEKTQMAISRTNEIKRVVSEGVRFYNNHYTAVTMLTIPVFLFATRAWYGKHNRKRYYRAEYLVAITYSLVMVVLFRCIVSIVYSFSKGVADSMGDFIPIVTIVAFTACFQKMLGFSIRKTVWRSLLALVLYYMVLGMILIITGVLVYVILFKIKTT